VYIYIYIYVCVCISMYRYIYLSIFPSIHPSIWLSIFLSISISISVFIYLYHRSFDDHALATLAEQFRVDPLVNRLDMARERSSRCGHQLPRMPAAPTPPSLRNETPVDECPDEAKLPSALECSDVVVPALLGAVSALGPASAPSGRARCASS